jgi:hypothetical protein
MIIHKNMLLLNIKGKITIVFRIKHRYLLELVPKFLNKT